MVMVMVVGRTQAAAYVTRAVQATCRSLVAPSLPPPPRVARSCAQVAGVAVSPVSTSDARRALHGQQRLVATRRWGAFQLVAPYRAWVSHPGEWEQRVPLTARSELQRYTVAASTGDEEATELLFCAHPAGFSNATCRINDCAVLPSRGGGGGTKRPRVVRERAADAAPAACSTSHFAGEGNCALMEVSARDYTPQGLMMMPVTHALYTA